MVDGGLCFLDARNMVARRDDTDIHYRRMRHLATIVASERNGQQSLFLCLLKRQQHIRRVATGGDSKRNIPFTTKSDDLARKDCLEANIIAQCRNDRAIAGQSKSW